MVSCSQGTGEDEDDVESSSSTLVQTEDGYQAVFFDPRPLKNLLLIDEVTSLMPITDLKVGKQSVCSQKARDDTSIPIPCEATRKHQQGMLCAAAYCVL